MISLLVSDFQRSVWSAPSILKHLLALAYCGPFIGPRSRVVCSEMTFKQIIWRKKWLTFWRFGFLIKVDIIIVIFVLFNHNLNLNFFGVVKPSGQKVTETFDSLMGFSCLLNLTTSSINSAIGFGIVTEIEKINKMCFNALSFYSSKINLDRPNHFGRVPMILVGFKAFWSGSN